MTIFSHLSYLNKHRFVERQIQQKPSPSLGMVVVIPCHHEPALLDTLDSIDKCIPPRCDVEIIIVINSGQQHSQEIIQQNLVTLEQGLRWTKKEKRSFRYHFLHFPQLPRKHAGVGLARKIGMDEAVDRLDQVNNHQGIIICLDADSRVQDNYLQAIESHFTRFSKAEACSIHYEHPTSGERHQSAVYEGIIYYELFLRYYIEGLRWAGYPHAYHTIGSSMAARSSAYQKRGGMNRRKAGEDFYFLQKFIQVGTLSELNTTTVIPSPRPSDRVPFGTGKSINQWLEGDQTGYPAYAWEIFSALKQFVPQVPQFYEDMPVSITPSLLAFLESEDWEKKVQEARHHVASKKGFVKRFFQWFDALKVLQYVHYAQEHGHPDRSIESSVESLFQARNWSLPQEKSPIMWLNHLRKKQKDS